MIELWTTPFFVEVLPGHYRFRPTFSQDNGIKAAHLVLGSIKRPVLD